MSNVITTKPRSKKNKTLVCTESDISILSSNITYIKKSATVPEISGKVIGGNIFHVAKYLPKNFVDLLFLDPPYNLSKDYNGHIFKEKEQAEYYRWFSNLIDILKPTLKPSATIYVCADWKTSVIIAPILEQNFRIRNRITWEREKGRGAKTNWKNNTEDIWYCTNSDDYYFNVDSVKLKRKVIAPYTVNGKPKDWSEEEQGKYRMTYPSNIWTDITIPFWSMPENTDHPTQKPEKLLAKLILASSKKNDFIFDPFLGSGTTTVVSKKLDRQHAGVELNIEYCCWALKRLGIAKTSTSIQGYTDSIFWERNTLSDQAPTKVELPSRQKSLL